MGLSSTLKDSPNPCSYFAELYEDEHADERGSADHSASRPTYPSDAQSLFLAGEKMLRAARRGGQSLALIVLELPDLAELEIVFGRDAADAAVHAVMQELSSLAGSKGIAARTSGDTFALLMPAMTGTTLQRALRARTGPACCVEFELAEYDIMLEPAVQAGTVAITDSLEKTYGVLCRTIASERHIEDMRRDRDGRRCNPSSRPVGLRPTRKEAPLRNPDATMPATIVMPIGRH